jgi:hypothetical protein
MMKPYEFAEARTLIEDAIHRARARHDWWETLETLFRTGRAGALSHETLSGTLWDTLTQDDLETFNLVLPRLNLQIAQLTARDPRPVSVPLTGGQDAEQVAKLTEAVCEYFWNRSNGTRTLRDMVQDFVVLGNGVCKVDWAYVEEEFEIDPETIEERLNLAVAIDATSALAEGREPADADDIRKYLSTTEARVLSDEPYIAYMRPYDLLVPVNARRLDETRWAAQRIIAPLDEIKERFPGKDVKPLPGRSDQLIGRDRESNFQEVEEAEIFEFWDARSRNLKVFQLDGSEPLYDGPWPYNHRYMPFVHMANYRARPSEFWGFGDLENIAGIQTRLNEVWTRIIDNLYRSGRKYLAMKGSLDADAIAALESDADEQVVFLNGPSTEDPSRIIKPLERLPLPGDVVNTQAALTGLMDQVMALNDFQIGGTGADRMSATAAAVAQGIAETRAADKQLNIEEAAARMYTLILLLSQEFMTDKTAVRIAGPTGTAWPKISGDDLLGEFQVRVETGSLNGQSRASRRQEGMMILTQVVPAIAGLGYQVDGLVRSALRRMSLDPDELGVTMPEPEPAAGAPAGYHQMPDGSMMADADMDPAAGMDPMAGMSNEQMMELFGGEPMSAQDDGEMLL